MEYHQPNQKYINVEYADFGTKNNLLWLTIPMMYKYDYKCVNRDKKRSYSAVYILIIKISIIMFSLFID